MDADKNVSGVIEPCENARDLALMIALHKPMTEWREALERVPEAIRPGVRAILLEFRENIRGGRSIMDG